MLRRLIAIGMLILGFVLVYIGRSFTHVTMDEMKGIQWVYMGCYGLGLVFAVVGIKHAFNLKINI